MTLRLVATQLSFLILTASCDSNEIGEDIASAVFKMMGNHL